MLYFTVDYHNQIPFLTAHMKPKQPTEIEEPDLALY